MRAFSHLEAGTPESQWLADQRLRAVEELEMPLSHLVVVAAHPDDETLGTGALMRRAHLSGASVTLIVASDGASSHPDSPTRTARELAMTRRIEVLHSVDELAPGAAVHFLSLPDGQLRENVGALEAALASIVDFTISGGHHHRDMLIVAPWTGDGHRDHRIAGECVQRVASARGIRHCGYPIWLWHWGTPDDLPWGHTRALALDDKDRAAKARALRHHRSQIEPLSAAAGDEAIVSPEMLTHFERDRELFVREGEPLEDTAEHEATLDASYFEDFHTRHDDPWGFETRWYEERKRALVIAACPDRDLGDVLEIGCSTGVLTAQLAPRARSITGVDVSATALERARQRNYGEVDARFQVGAVPRDWPAGRFDTVVVSEVGYYLSHADVQATIGRLVGALKRGATLLACHWRHPVADYPLSGDEVHRMLRAEPSWRRIAQHKEADFLLDVFEAGSARSVAQREGLV